MQRGLAKLILPGVLISLVISLGSLWLSGFHKLLDAFALAVLFGLIVGSLFPRKESLWMGTALCKDILLPLGLLLYGARVNFHKIAGLEGNIFFNTAISVVLGFTVVYFLCKAFGVSKKTSLLTCTGSVICGVSAIAVGTSMIDAKEEDTAKAIVAILAVGAIMLFSSVFLISKWFGGFNEEFAVFSGLTLNQTGLVKIAGNYMSKDLAKDALTVKFLRTSAIVPIGFIILFLSQIGQKVRPEVRRGAIKYGLTLAVLFFGASMLATFTPLAQHSAAIKPWYKFIWGMALASIGLTCDIRKIFKKEIIYNAIAALGGWIVVVAVYLGMLRLG